MTDLVGKPNETNQCGKGVSVMHDIIMMHIFLLMTQSLCGLRIILII